ncbi:MAG TPA: hypothetical protein PKE04_08015 [Clostridia bacterium]|nr:hypothetical protein [Clostridia bacterium]
MVITILLLATGLSIAGAGVYYYMKERKDVDSRKIYTIIGLVGLLITVGTIPKVAVWGW